MKKIAISLVLLLIVASCASSRVETDMERTQAAQGRSGQPPGIDQLLSEMDSDGDGKLSKSEAQGPIANDFNKIDQNSDGFITRSELENAPKPSRESGNGPSGRPPRP